MHTPSFRLWPNDLVIRFLTKWYQSKVSVKEMDDSLGGMFKLSGSNYYVWKSKMRDMLVCIDLWLLVQYGETKPNKIDASTWEVMHMKATIYI